MILETLSADLRDLGISHDAGVLAGGRALRMGGKDKGLLGLNNAAMISSSLSVLAPLAKDHQVLINCNREHANYRKLSSRLCSDHYPEFQGPLAGLHSILDASGADLVFVMPCDTPFVNEELINLLGQRAIKLVREGKTLTPIGLQCDRFKHPLHCCIPKTCIPAMSQAIQQGEHKLVRWFEDNAAEWVSVSDPSPLTNINTPHDLERAQRHLLNT